MKVHISVNVETRQIDALEAAWEYTHEGTRLEVEEPSRKVEIRGMIGDGAYDSKRNFNILEEKGMEPIMKVRGAPLNSLGDAHLGGKP